MKKITLLTIFVVLVALTSCFKNPNTNNDVPNPDDWTKFDYSTLTKTPVSISYTNMDGMLANVYFEIYDKSPVKLNEDGTAYVKIEGLEPLYAGTTNENGVFNKSDIELPSYLKKAYIYTSAFYARTLMEATMEGGVLTASDAFEPETAPATRASYESEGITKDGWKSWLGNYNKSTGIINYIYTGPLKVKNYKTLYAASTEVFNIDRACPTEYRSSNDLKIDKAAEVAITLLGSNTCWNSSMGYYFYKDGEKPKSLSEANVIMIFPNTQDGQWSVNPNLARKYKGVSRGTAVQLMYYPNIADNSKVGATTAFPADYRIGFVLATNGWTNRMQGATGSTGYRAATSNGLSVKTNGEAYSEPRTAVYRYTNAKDEVNAIIFSFEDYNNDSNFSDVVFTMISNPVDAVVDIPTVDDDNNKKTAKSLKGIYCFEDLWPSRGDYDLNDVMVQSNYEKIFNINGIYEESFILKTYQNVAGIASGLAVNLTGKATEASLSYSVMPKGSQEYQPAEFTREGNVVLITDNININLGNTYKITAQYQTPIADTQAGDVEVFIYSTTRDHITAGNRWELHIPYKYPTQKAEPYFFGIGDDCSNPANGVYYVRENSYPFAFFLSGATNSDLSKLLESNNESKPIDNIYPDYINWVTSFGKSNSDWYKK